MPTVVALGYPNVKDYFLEVLGERVDSLMCAHPDVVTYKTLQSALVDGDVFRVVTLLHDEAAADRSLYRLKQLFVETDAFFEQGEISPQLASVVSNVAFMLGESLAAEGQHALADSYYDKAALHGDEERKLERYKLYQFGHNELGDGMDIHKALQGYDGLQIASLRSQTFYKAALLQRHFFEQLDGVRDAIQPLTDKKAKKQGDVFYNEVRAAAVRFFSDKSQSVRAHLDDFKSVLQRNISSARTQKFLTDGFLTQLQKVFAPIPLILFSRVSKRAGEWLSSGVHSTFFSPPASDKAVPEEPKKTSPKL